MGNPIKKLGADFTAWRRTKYHRKRARASTIEAPSIIASNCIGGVISHDMGWQFKSPMVNLFIEKEDFIKFVNHLPEFLAEEVVEISAPNISYPVGQITYLGETVTVYFMHYHNFSEAKAKWDERKKRVDFDKIYVIQMITEGVTEEDIRAFDALPYKRKLLLANDNPTGSPNVLTLELFQKDYYNGKLLAYTSKYSKKRYLDDVDYISFFNRV